MKIYNECLNDLMNYFILADIYHLSEFAETNELSDNLMCEFTSNQSGDTAVNEGIILPICGIENYPYIVCFNMSAPSIFSAYKGDIQHQKNGYILNVSRGKVYLLTMPLLQAWSKNLEHIELSRPFFELDNGWYEVSINCGETLQESGWEPTIEFNFDYKSERPSFNANLEYRYAVHCREY